MPGKIKNLMGKVFERLTVVEGPFRLCKYNALVTFWKAYCSCDGNAKLYRACRLTTGETKSCGCLKKERGIKANTTHGMSRTSEYLSLMAAIQRCYYSKNKFYKYYGGRGIGISERYYKDGKVRIDNLVKDIGKKPSPKYSLERMENDKGYIEGNIKWATQKEQNNNRRIIPYRYSGDLIDKILLMRKSGLSTTKIAIKLKTVSPKIVLGIINRYKNKKHKFSVYTTEHGEKHQLWIEIDKGYKQQKEIIIESPLPILLSELELVKNTVEKIFSLEGEKSIISITKNGQCSENALVKV